VLKTITIENYYNPDFNAQVFIIRIPLHEIMEVDFTDTDLQTMMNASDLFWKSPLKELKALLSLVEKIEQAKTKEE